MNEQEVLQSNENQIDVYYGIWCARTAKLTETQKRLKPYLDNISEDFDNKLFDYISENQREAYYAGFATAMQLAADCYAESRKTVERG